MDDTGRTRDVERPRGGGVSGRDMTLPDRLTGEDVLRRHGTTGDPLVGVGVPEGPGCRGSPCTRSGDRGVYDS